MNMGNKWYVWGLFVCFISSTVCAFIPGRFWYGFAEFAFGLVAGHLIQRSNWPDKKDPE